MLGGSMRKHVGSAEGGFTLLELMAVVLILGILVSIAVASYTLSLERSRRVTCQMNQRTLSNAVLSYAEQHGSLPSALSQIEDQVSVAEGQFGRCPADSRVEYDYDPLNGRVTCRLHPPQ